ncbi:membrane protein [Asanoa ishikariensis]|uniref:Ion channel n=1 Tax=Asanoa ishikariensis TaxID=137265 RepID=A0A1H3RZW0_9ACTN|nr:potassium channel family protein [Asanoa ishikariensis]GIF66676.1 membrane protein [Asanoa ishikariensis]SDZ30835.1 Ion channel [Asanoa ishikariensis]
MNRAAWLRVGAAVVLLVALYYIVPVEKGDSGWRLVLRALAALVFVAGAITLVVWQIRRRLRSDQLPLEGLAVALVAGAMAFALADYVVAISLPTQFQGLSTRTDALYFALSTLFTVGFGDIHASGQGARVLVIFQMVFNIVVLATGASLLINQGTARVRASRQKK